MTAIPEPDDVWDSLFHGCAWAAYLDQMAEEGRFPPDSEATRRRCYRYYEKELARKEPRRPAPAAPAPLNPRSG